MYLPAPFFHGLRDSGTPWVPMAEAVGLGSHRAMAAEKYGTERRPEKPGEVAKPQGAVTARGRASYKGFGVLITSRFERSCNLCFVSLSDQPYASFQCIGSYNFPTPCKLTWHLKITQPGKGKTSSKPSFLGFHVNFPRC